MNGKCAYCRKPIMRRPGRSPTEIRKYCGKECYWEALRAKPRPKCLACGKQIAGRLYKNRKYCNQTCVGQGLRKAVKQSTFYDKTNGCWVGRLQINGGMQHGVRASTRAEVLMRLELLAAGTQRLQRPERWILPSSVRAALDLLLPLDHQFRLERQTQAVKMLEEALRYAELGFSPAPNSESMGSQPDLAHRHRPAWLAALPLGQVQ